MVNRQARFALVGGKAIKIEPGTQLNTITTYPTTIPISQPTNTLKAIPTAALINNPIAQLQPQSLGQPLGSFNIRLTGPNATQQQTSAWIANNTGIILSPSLTIRQIGEVRTVPTSSVTSTVQQIPTTATLTQPAYLVPQAWRSASFKSTSKPNLMPVMISKKRTAPSTVTIAPRPLPGPVERKESNDLEQFTSADDHLDSDEEDSDAERVLGHSDDNMYEDDEMEEDDGEDGNVQVDDDYKPPYRVRVKNRDQLNRQYSSGGGAGSSSASDKKEDRENSKDIKYQGGNEKPWVCKNCNRNYKWKNSLKCHLKNECGLPPKYFCARECGYKTNVHSNLKRHLNSKFCKSRDPTTEEGAVPPASDPDPEQEGARTQSPLLTVIKEEPL